MKCLLTVSAAVMLLAMTSSALVATPNQNTYVSKNKDKLPAMDSSYPKAWISLFQPPYQNCPEIMMDIGCTTKDTCYVPGGSNGVGFGVYRFDGTTNGEFHALNSTDNVEFDFTLFAGVAGTAEHPKGAVGGLSLWKGLKYFVNDSWLAPANIPISEEQSISTSADGEDVIMFDGFVENWPQVVLSSTDGGMTYTGVECNATPLNKTCTLPLFQAIGAKDHWVAAAGSFPETNNGGGNGGGGGSISRRGQIRKNAAGKSVLKQINFRYAYVLPGATKEDVEAHGFTISEHNPLLAKRDMIKAQKAIEREEAERQRKHHNDGPVCPYSAAIFSTTDGGKTWNTHDFNTSIWSPDAIACSDANTCLLVGSGMAQFPGSRVLKTTDGGKTWDQVLFLPSEGGEEIWAMNAVAYNPANPMEVWLGGGVQNPAGNFAVYFYSMDGGMTWNQSSVVNFVEMVIDISFTQEGNGFAVGITQFDDSTIMRYTADGFPQTPSPVYNGNFTQTQCMDNACSVNCTSLSLPQHTCLKLNGQGSAVATCDLTDRVLIQDIFPIDDKCVGPAEPQPQALGVCFELQGGGSFINKCGPIGENDVVADADAKFQVLPKKH